MLSIVDIKKELGKNIFLYPIYSDSIKGNSIDFHASEFAWSLKTQKRIFDGKKYLIIPANDTALIYTKEAIYVSNRIGGTYHSKVTLVSRGLGHIATTLDSQYLGNSIIAVHNHTDTDYKIPVDAEFVTVIFYYLSSPDYKDTKTHDNDPGHPRMITGFDGADQYIEWRDQNKWVVQENLLYSAMIDSPEYSKCKKDYLRELERFNRQLLRNRFKKYTFIIAVAVLITGVLSVPSYIVDLGSASIVFKTITERIALPVLLAVITSLVIVDFKKS